MLPRCEWFLNGILPGAPFAVIDMALLVVASWDAEPPVRYFQMGTNIWRTASQWPPPSVPRVYYLDGGGRLCGEKPTQNGVDTFAYDPADPSPTVGGDNLAALDLVSDPAKARWLRPIHLDAGPRDQRARVESRKDLCTFSTGILAEDVPVAGPVEATLHFSTNRTDTDVTIRLTDVYPDGRSLLVSDGIQRMSALESLEKPRAVEPGRVYPVKVSIGVTAQTFRRGHAIRLLVSSSNYPRFDANPNVFGAGFLCSGVLHKCCGGQTTVWLL